MILIEEVNWLWVGAPIDVQKLRIEGRKQHRAEDIRNKAGRFLLYTMRDPDGQKVYLEFPRRGTCYQGQNQLTKKLCELGIGYMVTVTLKLAFILSR